MIFLAATCKMGSDCGCKTQNNMLKAGFEPASLSATDTYLLVWLKANRKDYA
jgi:hypothetical protein